MFLSIIYHFLRLILVLILPFCLIVRVAVFLHFNQEWTTFASLTSSITLTSIVLVIYFSRIYGKLTKKKGNIRYLRRRFAIAFLLVNIFAINGMLFINANNTKTSEIGQEFRSLQPILRLACSILFLVDQEAIMTDASRLPEDYKKMGLSSKSSSLHYPQKDGYVYAIDLRTKGRSEIRNTLLKGYFYTMGLQSLRHVGTADHLHVSMPCRYARGRY